MPAAFATREHVPVALHVQPLERDAARGVLADDPDEVHDGGAPSAQAASPSGCRTSPGTRSMDSNPRRSLSEPGRTRQRTRKPRLASARTTFLPTKPVPPVTKMRCMTNES